MPLVSAWAKTVSHCSSLEMSKWVRSRWSQIGIGVPAIAAEIAGQKINGVDLLGAKIVERAR